jgi:hypothetical protein
MVAGVRRVSGLSDVMSNHVTENQTLDVLIANPATPCALSKHRDWTDGIFRSFGDCRFAESTVPRSDICGKETPNG